MTRILVGLACHKPDRRFLSSLTTFFHSVKNHELASLWIWDKTLVEAQNQMAREMMREDYDYLLTIEDDHWDFTNEMLESCLNSPFDVCGISYRNRHFPFGKIPMRYQRTDDQGVMRFSSINETSGYHRADLVSFGFTTISRKVFCLLDDPYFRLNKEYFKGIGPHATDIDFSARCKEMGVKIGGCFDYLLNHREIDEEKYKEMCLDGTLVKHSMFTHIHSMHMRMKKERLNSTEVCK